MTTLRVAAVQAAPVFMEDVFRLAVDTTARQPAVVAPLPAEVVP